MRISQRFNAHGRAPLHSWDKPANLQRGLRELFRNTQNYEPQISRYLDFHPIEGYEAFHNNSHPGLCLTPDKSGNLWLSLKKLKVTKTEDDFVIISSESALEKEFLVPKGIDEDDVFKAEERALLRNCTWISNGFIKSKGAKK